MSASTDLDWTSGDVPEPRAVDCYAHAARAFVAHFLPLLGIGFAVGLVVAASSTLFHANGFLALVGLALGAFVATPLKWGFYSLCLDAARGQRVDGLNLVRVEQNYREIVIAGVISGLIVLAGLVLLVLPGVYLYLRLQFVPYLVVDEGLDAGAAISESFRMTRGLEAPILGIVAIGALAAGVGVLMAGLGLLPALIWWDLAMASLYHAEVSPDAGRVSRPSAFA